MGDKHINNSSMCLSTINCLHNLSAVVTDSQDIEDEALETDLVKHVFAAIYRHIRHLPLQVAGYSLLWNLSAMGRCACQVVEQDGIRLAYDAMKRFRTDTTLLVPISGMCRNIFTCD